MKGILGQKLGMTQIFDERGIASPVTLIEVPDNTVTSVLTPKKDGYSALQLSIKEIKKSKHKKPEVGHFKKAKVKPMAFVQEMRNMDGFDLGDKVKLDIFNPGEYVDVIGTSKGKGFAGAIKRHNQSIGPKSHGGGGGSKPVRQTGSLGDISGNKVVKGMTMPGHMGHSKVTMQNLEIMATDQTNKIIVVKGSVPGPKKSFVIIRNAVKGLESKEPTKLVDLEENRIKTQLLEEASRFPNLQASSDMSIDEIRKLVDDAKALKQKAEMEEKAKQEEQKKAETEANNKKNKEEGS